MHSLLNWFRSAGSLIYLWWSTDRMRVSKTMSYRLMALAVGDCLELEGVRVKVVLKEVLRLGLNPQVRYRCESAYGIGVLTVDFQFAEESKQTPQWKNSGEFKIHWRYAECEAVLDEEDIQIFSRPVFIGL